MGTYTEIFVNVNLKEDVDVDVLFCLKAMCGDGGSLEGYPKWWRSLFRTNSYYHPNTEVSKLSCDSYDYGETHQWSLLGKGDIKNYDREIEAFFEWLDPWVAGEPGDFIGYFKSEDDRIPTLVFLK